MRSDAGGNAFPPFVSLLRRFVPGWVRLGRTLPGRPSSGSLLVVLPAVALLLANVLRAYFPGPATDAVFGAAVLALGLSLVRHRGPWPRATVLCFVALAVLYGLGLAVEFSHEGVRNLVAIGCAALIFLFGYRHAPELARRNHLAVTLLVAAVVLFPLYAAPAGLHPHSVAGVFGYTLLAVGVVLAVRGRTVWGHVAFGLAVVVGVVFGSRSLVLGLVVGYGLYWAGGFVLRSRRRLGVMAGGLGVVIGLVVFVLPGLHATPLLAAIDEFVEGISSEGAQSGRGVLWRVALARIGEAPWLGHGPGANLGTSEGDGEGTGVSRAGGDGGSPGELSCLDQASPGLAADCAVLLEARPILTGQDGDHEELWTWSAREPLHDWQGVELGGEPPRIIGLALPQAGLAGRIPTRLGELDGLQDLNLALNRLSGPIPPELGKLRNLKRLTFRTNRLTGPVPPELGDVAGLEGLWLDNNRLTGAVPAALGRLGRLSVLRLSDNEFDAPYPAALYAVEDHDLAKDLLCLPMPRTPPELLADCTALLAMQDVLASDADLNWRQSEPVDAWWGIVLGDEPLRVTGLHLYGASLNGRIPPELGNLDGLQDINLARNRLSGPIPPELGKLRHLHRLALDSNRLQGPIPPELGRLAVLSELWLRSNRLTGAVPATLGRLGRLSLLRLQDNEFDAPYPAALYAVAGHDLTKDLFCLPMPRTPPELLADCTALLAMRDVLAGDADLDWRQSEPVDSWRGVILGGYPLRVTELRLGGSDLNGRVPPELGNLDGLSRLDLKDNRLTGAVPATLGRLDRLSMLRLTGNEFDAPYPAALYAVADHDLGRDLFCLPVPGPRMPPELLRDCTALLAMRDDLAGDADLDWRQSDPVGIWRGVGLGGEPLRVTGLRLPRYRLNGRIPPQIGDLDALEAVDLGHNRLTGSIPPEVGRLAALRDLRLKGNWLSGVVPASLERLDRLSVLHLSGNEFSSPYPAALYAVAHHDLADDLLCLPMPRTPPELLADCTALLAMRDVLAGDAGLDWRRSEPVGSWQGVVVGGEPLRVTELRLSRFGLNGRIPPELARLDALEVVDLGRNRLDGAIPPALGKLRNLRRLVLSGNRPADSIPPQLRPVAEQDFPEQSLHAESRCRSLTGGLKRDCITLLDAQAVLGGDTGLGWDESRPIHRWPGVTVDKLQQRVVALDLSGRGLRGRLAPELGALDRLRSLRLGHNRLKGPIPPELGRLKGLQELVLDANALTGSIPAELARLESLKVLALRANGLSGAVPPTLDELAHLSLGGNNFSAPLPPALAERNRDVGDDLRCSSVSRDNRSLAVDCAVLLTVRDTLAGGAVLNWRDTVPIGLWRGVRLGGEPPQVIGLHLPESSLEGEIPPELGRLDALVSLRLDGNRLTGPVPAALGGLENLVALRLDGNRLTGPVPAALDELENLVKLRLENNRLSGTLPTADVSSRRSPAGGGIDETGGPAPLPGDVAPAAAGRMPRSVAPPAPEAVGKDAFCRPSASPAALLADCETLLAARAALTGNDAAPLLNWADSIPVGFWRGVTLGAGTPPRVVAVDLSRMGLSGRIPPELGKLGALRSLRLHRNRLSGQIPSELGALGNLQELVLGMNALTGPIPHELGKLDRLRLLHLRRNRLTGPIPATLGTLRNLRTLVLDANALMGPIPATLAALPNLDELWLKGNRLSGGVPETLAAPGRLSVLELGNDGADTGNGSGHPLFCEAAFGEGGGPAHDCAVLLGVRETLAGTAYLNWDGATPVDHWQGVELSGEPVRVTALNLARAGLNGTIPSELHALDRLVALRLSGNALTGPVPPELGRLPHLQVLALDDNALTGPLPPELANAPGLRELRLDGNALEGPVPRALTAHPDLAVLRVGAGGASAAAKDGDVPPPDRPCLPSVLGDAELLADCRVLLDVRYRLAGKVPLDWNEATPVAAWQGVTVEGAPERVVALELPGMGLNGHVPGDLARLGRLVSLRLEDNRLTGSIPGTLRGLRNLAVLRLTGNDFSGCMPPALAEAQDRDLELDLLCNPSVWAKPRLYDDMAALMSARKVLAGSAALNWDLARPVTEWQGVTVGGEPPRVVALDLSRTGLDGHLPPQLAALDGLMALRLGGNRLTGPIPPWLGSLTELRWLELNGNRLTGAVPRELGALWRLRRLWIEDNRLGGYLPQELERLAAAGLESVWLHGNRFTTGCLSSSLRYRNRTLVHTLGLPVCGLEEGSAQGIWPGSLDLQLPEVDAEVPTSRHAPKVSMSAHNLFLQAGLQSGIIGIVVLAALFASLLLGLAAPRDGVIGPARCLALASMVTVMVHSAFEVFLLQDNVVVSTVAWLLIGLCAGTSLIGEHARPMRKAGRGAARGTLPAA